MSEGKQPRRAGKPMGRPKGEETRMLHVRVPVRMLDQLETLQFVTKRKTSDVVRASLDMYIQANGEVLIAVAKARGGWPKESPQPGSVPLSFTREELEAAAEVAKQDEQDEQDEG